MIKPDLFDVIELLVNIPELKLQSGDRGAIVEKYSDRWLISRNQLWGER